MRALVIGGVLVALAQVASAQPDLPTPADLARAKELYVAAEAAMRGADFDGATRDYQAAHELTHDPALLFKLGQANERSGRCEIALVYYRRYLDEAQPNEAHAKLTDERIAVCNAAPATEPPSPGPEAQPPAPPAPPSTGTSAPPPTGDLAPTTGAALPGHDRAAWLFVAGGVTLLTVGAVLAYSADSAEKDIADLYVGFGGNPPTFDARTRRTYDDLVEQGRRYEHLSWLSLGLAGACGITAGVLFYRGRKPHDEAVIAIAPAASATSAGITALVRF